MLWWELLRKGCGKKTQFIFCVHERYDILQWLIKNGWNWLLTNCEKKKSYSGFGARAMTPRDCQQGNGVGWLWKVCGTKTRLVFLWIWQGEYDILRLPIGIGVDWVWNDCGNKNSIYILSPVRGIWHLAMVKKQWWAVVVERLWINNLIKCFAFGAGIWHFRIANMACRRWLWINGGKTIWWIFWVCFKDYNNLHWPIKNGGVGFEKFVDRKLNEDCEFDTRNIHVAMANGVVGVCYGNSVIILSLIWRTWHFVMANGMWRRLVVKGCEKKNSMRNMILVMWIWQFALANNTWWNLVVDKLWKETLWILPVFHLQTIWDSAMAIIIWWKLVLQRLRKQLSYQRSPYVFW